MPQLLHEVRVYARLGARACPHIVACFGHRIRAPPTPRVELYLEPMAASLRDHLTQRSKAGACLTVPEVRRHVARLPRLLACGRAARTVAPSRS